ncbi:MAG: serine/threonine protein kinase, partial [Deltaproteobacteria bacterium]|nr:serine/threonine protein kinase [Deltaproteobacteria bacterium]
MPNSAHRITQVIPQPANSDNASALTVAPRATWSLEGRKIGRYELIYHIASGGMASVYAARLTGMAGFERLVAIKVIHPHLALEPTFIQMFQDEARLAARISHPNVAEIYELGESDGIYYMAVELVRGKDLSQILSKSRDKHIALPLRFLVEVVRQICDGLSEAHRLKGANGTPLHLIHRDVSTRNILVSYSGHPKLIDFGAAFAHDRLAHTATGHIKGKIGYMPPEQIRGESLDHRADIYSLGVVLYTAATACHP